MASSTSNLDLISSSQASKEITANALFDASSVSTLFGRRASTTAALTWGYYGGVVVVTGTVTAVNNGTLALTANLTNYIEYNPNTGALVVNTTGWSAASLGYARVYSVVCGASTITSYTDWRYQGIGAPIAQFPMQYIGTWNASTNTPTLAGGTGTKGYFYKVSVTGTQDLGNGATLFTANDSVVYNGATWDKIEGGITAAEINAAMVGANMSANNFLQGYTTTATAAGTTTLTVSSTQQQFFTGTTTQTVVLPVTSTLTLGQTFLIDNESTGAVTVNSSGGNAVVVVAGGSYATVTCILLTGTTAASWDVHNLDVAIHGSPSKATPVDADEIGIWDSVSALLNKLTWANLKTTLGSTFAALAGSGTQVFSAANATPATQNVLPIAQADGRYATIAQATSSVAITGGTINGASVGATTPATGSFTSLTTTGTSGVGVTPQSWASITALEVGGAGNFVGSNLTEMDIGFNCYYNGGWKYARSGTYKALKFSIGETNEEFHWARGGTGTAGNLINGTGALTNMMTLSATGLSVIGSVVATTTIKTGGYTVGTLPAAGTVGRRAYVTDATAPTYLGALTGGGTVTCPVFDNGVAWVSA